MYSARCFLFGSMARGDHDASSDRDVLIVYDQKYSIEDRRKVKEILINHFGAECAFAEYTQERLDNIFKEGDLFSWHLYQEAKPVNAAGLRNDNEHSFHKPSPYLAAKQDAANFIELLASCINRFSDNSSSVVYEAGLAYLAIRNIGISLSALTLPAPTFDRQVPFKVAAALKIDPPCSPEIYDLLIAARHSSQRGLNAPAVKSADIISELIFSHSWAKYSLEIANDKRK